MLSPEKIPKNSDEIFRLCCKSKRGGELTPYEFELCKAAATKYPEWYKENQQRAFQATKPFGAR